MTNVVGFLRKTLKRSANVARRVGKMTRKTVKRGTNTIGLTKRRPQVPSPALRIPIYLPPPLKSECPNSTPY
jgi:hypothetical protein